MSNSDKLFNLHLPDRALEEIDDIENVTIEQMKDIPLRALNKWNVTGFIDGNIRKDELVIKLTEEDYQDHNYMISISLKNGKPSIYIYDNSDTLAHVHLSERSVDIELEVDMNMLEIKEQEFSGCTVSADIQLDSLPEYEVHLDKQMRAHTAKLLSTNNVENGTIKRSPKL